MFLSAQVMAKEEDKKDIDAFLSGDRAGLDRLVLRHQDRVYNLCYRLLGDGSDAEECAQETFIKALRAIKGFRFECSFSTWLYTIAVNICRNRRNSAEHRFWNRVLRFGQYTRQEEGREEFEIEDPAPSPLALMANSERDALLQSAIASLSHDHRTVIVLRHIEELSYEEICKITGYNLGTLKSKLARARLLLHNRLQLEMKRGGSHGMLSN
ncbi:RNA polymerase, sigma-24 subunit, ECF subfamily [Syntrophobacter sp. SbD1]|nr:RNA polymerase, sigma-24 subunit, ECF subfamily [Syntrophobacter sp. SbD1]